MGRMKRDKEGWGKRKKEKKEMNRTNDRCKGKELNAIIKTLLQSGERRVI